LDGETHHFGPHTGRKKIMRRLFSSRSASAVSRTSLTRAISEVLEQRVFLAEALGI
jgi:hypothetical protein